MHIRPWSACATALVMALGASGAAIAAPDAGQDWSGVYAGPLVGVQWTNARFNLPGDTADRLLSDHATGSGWYGGGVIGFNHQSGAFLVGIEGDLTGGDHNQQVTDCTTPDGCWTPAHDSWTTFNHLKEGLEGHARLRAGIVSGRTLFYVAGGYSVAKSTLDLRGECFNPGDPPRRCCSVSAAPRRFPVTTWAWVWSASLVRTSRSAPSTSTTTSAASCIGEMVRNGTTGVSTYATPT